MLGCAALPAPAQDPPQWFTDARAAQERAKQEDKFLLLDFTGSDWCGWCKKLKAEVFDRPEFTQFAQEHLVLVEVDFPRHKRLEPPQQEANKRLAQTYQISGYPTIILLDPDGRPAGQTGYTPGGPSAFIARLSRIMKIDPKTPPVRKDPPSRKPVAFVPIPPATPIHYGPLALKGISGTREHRFALINNVTFQAGETARVKSVDHEVVVHCQEIRDDSVLITADDKPMELKLGSH